MSGLKSILNLLSAVFGVVAAVVWFISAYRMPMPSYRGGTYLAPESVNISFYNRWLSAGRLNALAAASTGISVPLSAIGQLPPDHC